MNDSDKRTEIAYLKQGLEHLQKILPEEEYKRHEIEVNKKIAKLNT